MFKRKNNKKGFTVVELTIVVSVIAILSAVLIPTFASITKRARLSADEQAVRQMNVQLSAANAIDNIDNLEDAMNALDQAGYNALDTLVPVSKNHAFYWDNDNKSVVLVNTKDNTVAYPENYKSAFNTAWANLRDDGVQHINIVTGDVKDFSDALELGAKKVTLTEDITVRGAIALKEDANTVIALNGNTLDASKNSSRPFDLAGENTSLTIDATATGSAIEAGKYGLVNVPTGTTATVTMNGGSFTANEDSDNGAFVKVRSGASANVVLNNVTYIDETGENYLLNCNGAEDTTTLTIKGGKYQGKIGFQAGQVVVEDAEIITEGYAFYLGSATENTIKNCKITAGNVADTAGLAHGAIVAANGAKVTVENCEITTNGGISAFFVTNSGATITATGITGATNVGSSPTPDADAIMYASVDGTVVLDKKGANVQ